MKKRNSILFFSCLLLFACQGNSASNAESMNAEETSVADTATKENVKTFNQPFSSTVVFDQMQAEIHVKLTDQKNPKVILKGPDSLIALFTMKNANGTLTIHEDLKPEKLIKGKTGNVSFGNSTITQINGDDTSITNLNDISIDGDVSGITIINGTVINNATGSFIIPNDNKYPIVAEVYVPIGTRLQFESIYGIVSVDDINGNISISNVHGDVSIGKTKNVTIEQQGGADIQIQEINGTLDVTTSGSGDITLHKGFIPDLTVNMVGSGDFSFYGEAGDASISKVGSGDTYIKRVQNDLQQSCVGSGKVTIGK